MSQSLFVSLYRQWLWIGPPLFVLALAALCFLIVGLVAAVKRAHLFKVPVCEKQEVRFEEADCVVLCTEGPRLSRRFAGMRFELRAIDGDPVPARRALFRARTSGVSTVRTEHTILHLPRAGRYLLTMTGSGAGPDPSPMHAVVFVRPHLLRSIASIVGILLAAGLMILSLVFFLLRLRGTTEV